MKEINSVDIQVKLFSKIIENRISKRQVVSEIERMEQCYGKDVFTSYRLNPAKKPWTKAYYQELEDLGVSGAASKEFFLRLVEVRDTLKRRKICVVAACSAVMVILAALIAFWVSCSKTGA